MRFLIQKQKKFFINPSKHLSPIGSLCGSCKKKLKYNSSISICQCFLYGHEQCFLQKIRPYCMPGRKMHCTFCDSEIKLQAQMDIKYECPRNSRVMMLFLMAAILMMITIIMTMLGVYEKAIDSCYIYVFSGLVLAMILVATVYYSRKVQIKSLKITPTDLVLKQSAMSIDFDDKDLQSMQTNIQMIIS